MDICPRCDAAHPKGKHISRVPVPWETLTVGTPAYNAYVDGLVKRFNSGEMYATNPARYHHFATQPVFSFRTHAEAHLWIDEFLGQISDGKWEGSFSNPHWKAYFEAKVVVNHHMPTCLSYFPYHDNLGFTDLLWLFSNNSSGGGVLTREKSRTEARAVFSKVADEDLIAYMHDISAGINGKNCPTPTP